MLAFVWIQKQIVVYLTSSQDYFLLSQRKHIVSKRCIIKWLLHVLRVNLMQIVDIDLTGTWDRLSSRASHVLFNQFSLNSKSDIAFTYWSFSLRACLMCSLETGICGISSAWGGSKRKLKHSGSTYMGFCITLISYASTYWGP